MNSNSENIPEMQTLEEVNMNEYTTACPAPKGDIKEIPAESAFAVLASLADTLMPEAFEHGRPFNAFATAAGFFLSFILAA